MAVKTVNRKSALELREERKSKIREDFEQLFESYGVGQRSIRFVLNGNRKHHMLRPKAKVSRDGLVFNMRYLSLSDSPFIEDQELIDFDESTRPLDAVNIYREIIAPATDPCLQKYLILHPFRDENGGKIFTMYMPEKIAKKSFDAKALRYKADKYIMESDESKIDLVGTVLTKDFSGTFKLDDIEIKQNKLLNMAESDPMSVINAFESDEVAVKSLVYNAVSTGILKIDKNAGKVTWGTTGQRFMDFIPSKDAVNAISNFLSTQEGEAAKDRLVKELGTSDS